MKTETGFGGLVEKLAAAGGTAAEASSKFSAIGLDAAKKSFHSQIELVSALVELGSEQLRSLGSLSSPAVFLQRQKEVGEVFGGKLHAYVESLREIGVEAQAGYTAAATDLASGLGIKAA